MHIYIVATTDRIQRKHSAQYRKRRAMTVNAVLKDGESEDKPSVRLFVVEDCLRC